MKRVLIFFALVATVEAGWFNGQGVRVDGPQSIVFTNPSPSVTLATYITNATAAAVSTNDARYFASITNNQSDVTFSGLRVYLTSGPNLVPSVAGYALRVFDSTTNLTMYADAQSRRLYSTNATIAVDFSSTNVTITGSITANGGFYGSGSGLTGLLLNDGSYLVSSWAGSTNTLKIVSPTGAYTNTITTTP